MIQCPTCKQVLEPGVRFCPHDGTPLTETAAFAGVPTPTGERPASREIALPVVIGGRYRLEEVRGGGGMAKVYRGVDVTLEREVAVKLIKAGMDSHAVLARFEAERQALAVMDHPNIAKVLDGGSTEGGLPFFVMELVKGTPITRYCDEHRLPLRQRLELFVPVCQAL